MEENTIRINNQNILLIGDTHGLHRFVNVPDNIHIIIHCGDICNDGNIDQITDFFEWFENLNIPHKIFIHGNHDLPFDLEPEQSKTLIPDNVHWLNDKAITINQTKILGISAFPFFQNTNSNYDIIVSHYPPQSILDDGYGSKEIHDFIIKNRPKYHVFGHNHNGYGSLKINDIQFINASIFHILT